VERIAGNGQARGARGIDRIGVYGGTFDPIHVGHLVAAIESRRALELDRVLFVVANEPWQKVATRALTSAEDRFRVVSAAVDGVAGLEASRMEIDRGGPSYTADTVRDLLGSHPGATLYLVVGADVAADLDTWQRVDEIRHAVRLVVVERGGVTTPHEPAGWDVVHLPIPALDISSSDLRDRLAEGRSVQFLIPEPAIRCIRRLDLYAGAR
jgi:nicotinate-nucleotide adenylyltransferase